MQLSLEEELRLPSTDLRSHGWYHGGIGRPIAESLLTEDGAFLVRDCLSQPNDFVLSCQQAGSKLHFIINRVFLMPNTLYERVQYQLEDDFFDTIADLVTFYVGNRRAITQRSGAQICRPVIRRVALGVTAEAPPPPKPERNYSNAAPPRRPPTTNGGRTPLRKEYARFLYSEPDPEMGAMKFRPQHKGVVVGERSSDPLFQSNTNDADGTASTTSSHSIASSKSIHLIQGILRETGAKSIARGMTLVDLRLLRLDFGAASCSESMSATGCGKNNRIGNGNINNSPADFDSNAVASDLGCGALSGLEILTLPHGERLRQTVNERSNYVQLMVIATILSKSFKESIEMRRHSGEGSASGDECEATPIVYLTKWIQIAAEIKASLGNLYGFQNIMSGLMHPSVTSRKELWHQLRQRSTDLALLFETKLRQEVSSLASNHCCDSIAPNTCIPNINLFVNLQVQLSAVKENNNKSKNNNNNNNNNSNDNNNDNPREDESERNASSPISSISVGPATSGDFGLSTLLSHLENMSSIVRQTDRFRKNAASVVACTPNISHEDFAYFETEYLVNAFNEPEVLASHQHLKYSERERNHQRILKNLAAV